MAQPADTTEQVTKFPEKLSMDTAKWLYENLMTPAKNFRRTVGEDGDYSTHRRLFDGDHWQDMAPPEGFDPVTANIVMPAIDTAKGIALQSSGFVEFSPMNPDDMEFAQKLTTVVGEYLWSVRKGRYKLGVWWNEGAIIGTAFAHPFWNESLLGGEGDVDFYILPTDECYLDPSCTSMADSEFFIHAAQQPVRRVKYDLSYSDDRLDIGPDNAESAGQKEGSEAAVIPLVTVFEYWVRGSALEALAEEVEGLAAKVGDVERKYGIRVTCAGGRTMKFTVHPWQSDRFPFARYIYYARHGNYQGYGRGEVYFIKDLQLAVDARLTQLLNHAALITNGQKVVYNGSVTDESEITAVPGQVIHVDGPPGSYTTENPSGISGSLFSITDMLVRLSQVITGMYDVNRGQEVGRMAGVAIQALQRGGEGRTAQKVANFDDAAADLALIIADIMAVKYDSERVYRISGVTATEQELTDESGAPTIDPTTGLPVQATVIEQDKKVTLSKADFWKGTGKDAKRIELDTRAMVGRMLRNLEEQLQADVELLQAGVVDAQYVIENNQVILRNADKLLARLMAMQNAAPQGGETAPPPEAAAPVEQGAPPEPSEQEKGQMSQVIDAMLAQIQQLEQEGTLPQGISQQIASMVEQEIAAGGTGEKALAEAKRMVEQYLAQAQTGSGAVAEGTSPADTGQMPPQAPMM
jgi:hypothetical protein